MATDGGSLFTPKQMGMIVALPRDDSRGREITAYRCQNPQTRHEWLIVEIGEHVPPEAETIQQRSHYPHALYTTTVMRTAIVAGDHALIDITRHVQWRGVKVAGSKKMRVRVGYENGVAAWAAPKLDQ